MWQVLKSSQLDNVCQHYYSDSCKRKTPCAAAAISLHASQPTDKRQWLLCTNATTTASPEKRSTCDESFASNDSVASVEHNQPKPFCCGYVE